jgi:hypothetical protein
LLKEVILWFKKGHFKKLTWTEKNGIFLHLLNAHFSFSRKNVQSEDEINNDLEKNPVLTLFQWE